MAKIKRPEKALVIVGLIYRHDFTVDKVMDILNKELGNTALSSRPIQFTYTSYYNKEMGDKLLRQWLAFDKLVDPDILATLKHRSNDIERFFLDENKGRKINIDPGLITMSNLILASTKDYSHRLYIGKGIYAEVTLIYKNKRYMTLEWTYPDYQANAALAFFEKARGILKDQLGKQINPRSNDV
jgi:hypothetical protein